MSYKFDPHRPYQIPMKCGFFCAACPQNEICPQLRPTRWLGALGKDRSSTLFTPNLVRGLGNCEHTPPESAVNLCPRELSLLHRNNCSKCIELKWIDSQTKVVILRVFDFGVSSPPHFRVLSPSRCLQGSIDSLLLYRKRTRRLKCRWREVCEVERRTRGHLSF